MKKQRYINLGKTEEIKDRLIIGRTFYYKPTKPIPENEIIEREGKIWIELLSFAKHFHIHPEIFCLDFVLKKLGKEVKEFETE